MPTPELRKIEPAVDRNRELYANEFKAAARRVEEEPHRVVGVAWVIVYQETEGVGCLVNSATRSTTALLGGVEWLRQFIAANATAVSEDVDPLPPEGEDE